MDYSRINRDIFKIKTSYINIFKIRFYNNQNGY